MLKKEVIKKWRLNKDSIVLIAFSNALIICRKSNSPFPIFFAINFLHRKNKAKFKKIKKQFRSQRM